MRFLLFRINLYTWLIDHIERPKDKLVSKYIRQACSVNKGEQQ